MRCETCNGTGRVKVDIAGWHPTAVVKSAISFSGKSSEGVTGEAICPVCFGSGIAYCCEGENCAPGK